MTASSGSAKCLGKQASKVGVENRYSITERRIPKVLGKKFIYINHHVCMPLLNDDQLLLYIDSRLLID